MVHFIAVLQLFGEICVDIGRCMVRQEREYHPSFITHVIYKYITIWHLVPHNKCVLCWSMYDKANGSVFFITISLLIPFKQV